MKKCPKCKTEKEETEYHKDPTKKDGLCVYCKKCRKNPNKMFHNNRNLDKLVNKSIKESIKKNKNGYIWESIVGCKLEFIKMVCEKRWEPGMNWENYGEYWIIERIIPGSLFSVTELKKSWNWKNLRPVKRIGRINKRTKVDWSLVEKYKLYDIIPISIVKELNIRKLYIERRDNGQSNNNK